MIRAALHRGPQRLGGGGHFNQPEAVARQHPPEESQHLEIRLQRNCHRRGGASASSSAGAKGVIVTVGGFTFPIPPDGLPSVGILVSQDHMASSRIFMGRLRAKALDTFAGIRAMQARQTTLSGSSSCSV